VQQITSSQHLNDNLEDFLPAFKIFQMHEKLWVLYLDCLVMVCCWRHISVVARILREISSDRGCGS